MKNAGMNLLFQWYNNFIFQGKCKFGCDTEKYIVDKYLFELSIILDINVRFKHFCQFCTSKLNFFEEITIFRKKRKLTLLQNCDCQSPSHIDYPAECPSFPQQHRS